MSVQLWNFKDSPKMQAFCLIINILKEFFKNNPTMNNALSKSAKIVLSMSIFFVKTQWIFFKKKSSKNINLGDHFLKKEYFFLTSIFEPLHFLKSCSIFDKLLFPAFSKYNGFFEYINFGQ